VWGVIGKVDRESSGVVGKALGGVRQGRVGLKISVGGWEDGWGNWGWGLSGSQYYYST